jgi:PKD repeat protein
MRKYFTAHLVQFCLLLSVMLSALGAASQTCSIIGPANGKGCLNTPTCFTCSPPGGCVPVNNGFDWDWGDGNSQPASTQNACHTYYAPNPTGYTISCKMRCSNGSSVTCTYIVKVYSLPIADFSLTTANTQCDAGNSFCIKDLSTSGSSGADLVYRKVFWGDGSYDETTGNPSPPVTGCHHYDSYIAGGINGVPHKYKVAMEVIDANGCKSVKEIPDYITVNGKMDVKFASSFSVKCDSTPVVLTNTSIDLMNAWASRPTRMKSFIWDFGDGNTYTGYSINDPKWTSFTHLYKNKMGPFDISLTVVDSDNCSGSYTLKNGGDNIFMPADFKVTKNTSWSDSDSSCYKANLFHFKLTQPVHPVFIFKTSYNFDDPNAGAANTYPNVPDAPVLWSIDHVFTDCGIYHPTITVTAYQPNGATVICSKTKKVYVKIWGPHAAIQDAAKGICVLNRFQCHIKDTVKFTNISTYCLADSAQTVLRLWDFDDISKALPCTTYSDPVNIKYTDFSKSPPVNRFAYRMQDTMNIGKNCNYSMDSLPYHWYSPGSEKCYSVKLSLHDNKTGCDDIAQLSLALQSPDVKNAIDLSFVGKTCLSTGNDDRKVVIKWERDQPLCANQFVWINFDSACGANAFVAQTAFNPITFSPPLFYYGCSYLGNTSYGSAGPPAIAFSQQGHTFLKSYTRQYTSVCNPEGNITIGIVVQNGCDSAIISLADSTWNYWSGCVWESCVFSNTAQKSACMAAHPNSASFPAFARHNNSKVISYFNASQKAAAMAALPSGVPICYACRDTFWYHNAIQYNPMPADQDAATGNKLKYCVGESADFCPDKFTSYQGHILASTWRAYLQNPGKSTYKNSAPDTIRIITDTIYRKPSYKRLRWNIRQYNVNGIYFSDTSAPVNLTSAFRRDTLIDTTFCYKLIGSALTKVVVKVDTVIRDSSSCGSFVFSAPGKWVVDLILTNTDTCEKNFGRVIIVGNKIDVNINDTVFCAGEAVKPKASIRYWWRRLPPQPPYDVYDYWNDHVRNPAGGGSGNKEMYWYSWGDGGPFIQVDTNIRSLREHLYASTGTYSFKVAWKDSDGCYDTLEMKNLIHVVKPHAAFSVSHQKPACGQQIQFNDSSWIESGLNIYNTYDSILFWSWDFGDGSLKSNLKNPVYKYERNGDYTVTLKIFTREGCVDTASKEIHIAGPVPEFDIYPGLNDTGCVSYDASILFTHSSDTSFRTVQINWGDGTMQTLTKALKQVPFAGSRADHKYTTVGQFCVEIFAIDTVTDDTGNLVTCISKFPSDTAEPRCFTVLDCSGIRKPAKDHGITVYPNPAHESFTVYAEGMNVKTLYLTVYDLQGRIIVQRNLSSLKEEIKLETSPGAYFVTLEDGERKYTVKLLVE